MTKTNLINGSILWITEDDYLKLGKYKHLIGKGVMIKIIEE